MCTCKQVGRYLPRYEYGTWILGGHARCFLCGDAQFMAVRSQMLTRGALRVTTRFRSPALRISFGHWLIRLMT
jgi:phosphate-selective porin